MIAAMRRRASVWAVVWWPRNPSNVWAPKGLLTWKAKTVAPKRSWPGRAAVPDGVFDHGTQEEDGPVTREALAAPRKKTGATETR